MGDRHLTHRRTRSVASVGDGGGGPRHGATGSGSSAILLLLADADANKAAATDQQNADDNADNGTHTLWRLCLLAARIVAEVHKDLDPAVLDA